MNNDPSNVSTYVAVVPDVCPVTGSVEACTPDGRVSIRRVQNGSNTIETAIICSRRNDGIIVHNETTSLVPVPWLQEQLGQPSSSAAQLSGRALDLQSNGPRFDSHPYQVLLGFCISVGNTLL